MVSGFTTAAAAKVLLIALLNHIVILRLLQLHAFIGVVNAGCPLLSNLFRMGDGLTGACNTTAGTGHYFDEVKFAFARLLLHN